MIVYYPGMYMIQYTCVLVLFRRCIRPRTAISKLLRFVHAIISKIPSCHQELPSNEQLHVTTTCLQTCTYHPLPPSPVFRLSVFRQCQAHPDLKPRSKDWEIERNPGARKLSDPRGAMWNSMISADTFFSELMFEGDETIEGPQYSLVFGDVYI